MQEAVLPPYPPSEPDERHSMDDLRSLFDDSGGPLPEPEPEKPKLEHHLLKPAILGTVVLFAVLLLWPARYGGIVSFVIVQGPSMQPAYNSGDLAIAVKSPWQYNVGDVIVFSPSDSIANGARVIHRIVALDPDGSGRFLTQGDNKPLEDPWNVSRGDIDGVVVFTIPAIGEVTRRLSSSLVLAFGAGGVAVILLWPSQRKKRGKDEDDQNVVGDESTT